LRGGKAEGGVFQSAPDAANFNSSLWLICDALQKAKPPAMWSNRRLCLFARTKRRKNTASSLGKDDAGSDLTSIRPAQQRSSGIF
jgi:hypothetical protein